MESPVNAIQPVPGVPGWLPGFLKGVGVYFTDCSQHSRTNAKTKNVEQSSKKGERNLYCIDCPKGPICSSSRQLEHAGHRVLQVRKASHMDAIRVSDITPLIDITHIQTYIINAARIVFLPSRPQQKPTKSSSYHCEMCGRTLQDHVRFCSLSCKLDAFETSFRKRNGDPSIVLKASGLPAGARVAVGGKASGDDAWHFQGVGEDGPSDVSIPQTPSPASGTTKKKRARSSNKGHPAILSHIHTSERPPIKNLKVHREHAPGVLTGRDGHLIGLPAPQSPISVLHHDIHKELMPEFSGLMSAGLDSSSCPDESPEVTSLRKKPRKGVPFRAAGLGIQRPDFCVWQMV